MSHLGLWRQYVVHNERTISGFFGEYRWLSNFHICSVVLDGVVYFSSEHAYQAAKTENSKLRNQVLTLSCVDVRKWGQNIELRQNWDILKLWYMFQIILDKFTRNNELTTRLLNTGIKSLVELNHWGDVFWGIDFQTNKGHNYLGKTLESVRNHLRLERS